MKTDCETDGSFNSTICWLHGAAALTSHSSVDHDSHDLLDQILASSQDLVHQYIRSSFPPLDTDRSALSPLVRLGQKMIAGKNTGMKKNDEVKSKLVPGSSTWVDTRQICKQCLIMLRSCYYGFIYILDSRR